MQPEAYSIPLRRLENGHHTFSFDCGPDLFERIEGALYDNCRLRADVDVRKNDQMMVLDFTIAGTVEVECAVCLGKFDYQLEECGGRITLRLGDHYEEVDDELYEVDDAQETLDLSQWIYELAVVAVPIRCEHPLGPDGYPTCDPDMVDELQKYLVDEDQVGAEPEPSSDPDAPTDPRWDALRALLPKDLPEDKE